MTKWGGLADIATCLATLALTSRYESIGSIVSGSFAVLGKFISNPSGNGPELALAVFGIVLVALVVGGLTIMALCACCSLTNVATVVLSRLGLVQTGTRIAKMWPSSGALALVWIAAFAAFVVGAFTLIPFVLASSYGGGIPR